MKRILVADEAAVNRYEMVVLLQGHGYEVITTNDGADAVACGRRHLPDLIISDILMPVMDGFELCRQWHAEEPLRDIPFLFYADTHSDARDEQRAMDLGADRYVVRPKGPQELIKIIEELLAREAPTKPTAVASLLQTDEAVTLREYNEALVRKLEKKTTELETTREALEADIRQRHQIEAILRQSEEHWRLIYETEPECVAIVSAEGRLLAMNPAGLRMVGADSLDQVYDKSVLNLIVPEHRDAYFAMHRSVIGGRSRQLKYEIIGLRGRRRWMETHAVPLHNDDGTVSHLAVTHDITDRKAAEAALLQSEQYFRLLFEQATDGVTITNTDGRFVDANELGCRMLGYSRDELLTLGIKDIVPHDELHRIAPDVARLAEGGSVRSEWKALRKDRSTFFCEVSARQLPDGRIQSFLRDITEKKQSEALANGQKLVLELIASGKPLAESLTALLTVVEKQSTEMVCSVLLLDSDGIHLSHGAAPSLPAEYCRAIDGVAIGPDVGSCGTAAYTRERVIVGDIATDPLWANFKELALYHGLRACWSVPIFGATRRVLGTFAMYYLQPARPNEQQLRLIEMAADTASIAISKHQEEEALLATQVALQSSEQRLFKLFRNSPDAVAVVSLPEGRVIDVNDQFVELTGYNRSETFSRTTLELGIWEYPAERERFYQLVREPAGTRLFDATLRTKSGELREMQYSSDTIELDGRICAITTARDITAQKQAEELLRVRERQLRLFVEHSPAAIAMFDNDMRYLVVSLRWRSDFQLCESDLMGQSHYDIFPDTPQRWKEIHRRCLAGAVEKSDADPFLRADGTTDWIRWEARPWHTTHGDIGGIIIFSEDITDRVLTQAELHASRERLEGLSRQLIATQESERRHLALELHDEIGQSLTGIKLNLRALQQPTQATKFGTLVQDMIGMVDETLRQVRSLALDLRPPMLDDIGLAAALRWCLDGQAQRAGFGAQFYADPPNLSISPEVATTCFRVAQECLTNIARHAQAQQVRVELRQHDTHLALLITDNGIGFDVKAAQARTSRGASIGLLGIRERIALIGGQLEIESTPSQGTTIRARFPCVGNSSSDKLPQNRHDARMRGESSKPKEASVSPRGPSPDVQFNSTDSSQCS